MHGGSVSVGATGNFATPLVTNPSSVTFNTVTPTGITLTNTVTNQSQYITSSVGFLTSLQFHPAPWAGIEVNYGYQHYSERVNYNLASNPSAQTASIPTTTHEATAAYQFHPKHIPFQPFVNIGGGAIDFAPTANHSVNQWRGAGLLETGSILLGLHAAQAGPSLVRARIVYRTPNFFNTALSTRGWRASAEPSASLVYRC